MAKDGEFSDRAYEQTVAIAGAIWRQLLQPHFGILGEDNRQRDKVGEGTVQLAERLFADVARHIRSGGVPLHRAKARWRRP